MAAMQSQEDSVAAAFIGHYYSTLDTNASALAGLYQPTSSLTFEGNKFEGPQAIVEKLLSIGQVQHNTAGITRDVQVSTNPQAMVILVTGQLKIADNQPIQFSEVFQLVATGPGQYYVHNQIFRLVLA